MYEKPRSITLLVVLLLLFLSFLVTVPVYGQKNGNPNPGILPPWSHSHGKTVGEWMQVYGTRELSMPADQSPFSVPGTLYDIQDGSLFYLELINDTYVVSTGTSILLPMDWVVMWMPEDRELARWFAEQKGLDPDALSDEELVRLAANEFTDNYQSMYCRINGRPIEKLDQYRFETPTFDLDVGEGWWGCPAGLRSPAIFTGHAILLAPLPPGEYFIERGGVWWGTDIYHFETRLIVR